MRVDYRGSLSTVYNDGEISTCGWIIENLIATYLHFAISPSSSQNIQQSCFSATYVHMDIHTYKQTKVNILTHVHTNTNTYVRTYSNTLVHIYTPDGPIMATSSPGLKYSETSFRITCFLDEREDSTFDTGSVFRNSSICRDT